MQTSNPVLARIDREAAQASKSGAGFAYEEGRTAVAAAERPATAGTPAPEPAPGGSGTKPGLYAGVQIPAPPGQRVTMPDIMAKSAILFVVATIMAVVGWQVISAVPTVGGILMFAALIGTVVLGIVNAVKRQVSPPMITLYAVVSGFMLGAISYWYNQIGLANEYEGLVLQAVLATFTTFGVMLLLYGTGLVKVTNKFVKFLTLAMGAYFVIALASLVGALFGVGGGWGFYSVGTLGLLLCLFGVGLAAFTLMLDFEAIKQGIAMGLPERESWRLSFGLLVTLVWLYLEFLRLFAIIASGRD
jgi:uncharacterized YccA/Bax inhibitor family protein